jgi:CRP-like cAMP-binding protein
MHDGAISSLSIQNRILSLLPPDEFDFILPRLQPVTLATGTLFAHAGDRLQNCFFPENGMVSLLSVTENGHTCEAGYTGFEGFIGLPVIFKKNEMPYQALVQAPTNGFKVDVGVVSELFRRNGVFHDAVLRFAYVIVRQMAQTCVCNHFHPIQARLCRWLSVMVERSGNRHLTLTQEFLAHMLGVQRTSVGMIAGELQKNEIIRYRRGNMQIIDYDRLVASACECYRIVADEYRDYLNDSSISAMSDVRQTLSTI